MVVYAPSLWLYPCGFAMVIVKMAIHSDMYV